MLAMGRGLVMRGKVMLLDEPSMGLAPRIVSEIFRIIVQLRYEKKSTILLVEQNVREALDLADRGYILQTGRVIAEGTGKELLASDLIRSAFLGI